MANFGDITNELTLGPGESVRRNDAGDGFEVFTSGDMNTSVYDPEGLAKKIAFFDEVVKLDEGIDLGTF